MDMKSYENLSRNELLKELELFEEKQEAFNEFYADEKTVEDNIIERWRTVEKGCESRKKELNEKLEVLKDVDKHLERIKELADDFYGAVFKYPCEIDKILKDIEEANNLRDRLATASYGKMPHMNYNVIHRNKFNEYRKSLTSGVFYKYRNAVLNVKKAKRELEIAEKNLQKVRKEFK